MAAPDRAKVAGEDSVLHEKLTRELEALRTKQLRGELAALKVEASRAGVRDRNRRRDGASPVAQPFGLVEGGAVPPFALPRAARRRDPAAKREAAAAPADSRGAIVAAEGLIRAGRIDDARQLLRRQGTSAATRALADTYNPLTNTQYGAIGVDSDADRAAYLYRQADSAPR